MYIRSSGRKGPAGVGNQLARATGSAGSVALNVSVSEPLSSYTSPGVRSPIEYRSIGFDTR